MSFENVDPLADIARLAQSMPGPDAAAIARVEPMLIGLGPFGAALGTIAGWQGRGPRAQRLLLAAYAAPHGIARHAGDKRIAASLNAEVAAVAAGETALDRICREVGIGLKLFELALDQATPDVAEADAFAPAGLAATVAFGMEPLAERPDVIAVTSLGDGAPIAAAAVLAGLTGAPAGDWLPPQSRSRHVVDAVERAARRGAEARADPLELLRRIGARDSAAMLGAILAARHQRAVVMLDGMAALAAAAILDAVAPGAARHCLLAERPRASCARALAEALKVPALTDLGVDGQPGIAGALALGLLRNAVAAVPTERPALNA